MLWPQAWPMPGSASYSAQMPMTSGPEPAVATNAVGQVGHAGLDLEAGGGQRLGAPGAAPHLLEAKLGIGVDPVAEVDEGGTLGVDELLGGGLHVRGHRVRR